MLIVLVIRSCSCWFSRVQIRIIFSLATSSRVPTFNEKELAWPANATEHSCRGHSEQIKSWSSVRRSSLKSSSRVNDDRQGHGSNDFLFFFEAQTTYCESIYSLLSYVREHELPDKVRYIFVPRCKKIVEFLLDL